MLVAHWWRTSPARSGSSCQSPEPPPFEANNYTDQRVAPDAIELQLLLATIAVTPGAPFRLAFVLTDTKRDYELWPAGAQLGVPATWVDARAVP